MLKEILSISGKPGLHKIIHTGKNLTVAESLSDGKRFPVYVSEKVVSLGDIAIYTQDDETPLRDVLKKIKEKENGKTIDVKSMKGNGEYFNYFAEILPNFDREKVYASDLKKLFGWYNILIEKNIDFDADEDNSDVQNNDDAPDASEKDNASEE